MPEVAVAINCTDPDCAESKIRHILSFLPKDGWLHLDAADGRFTFGKSWQDAGTVRKLAGNSNLEVHLMAEEPELALESWLDAGAKRIVMHLESFSLSGHRVCPTDPFHALNQWRARCEERGAKLVLAINAETPVRELAPYLSKFSDFQIFAQAQPGPAGQPFLSTVLPKIKWLREMSPRAIIEVDGGMIPETVRKVCEAGANWIISGSYILNSPDPIKNYLELKNMKT
ncbi:MAG TPA: hypothetical protein VJL32_00925 [Candidatus Paceibacterota bacterium]